MAQTRDLIYDVEGGSVAVLTFEAPSSHAKCPKWATVRALLSAHYEDVDDMRIDASYLSHEGEATEADIAYALRCIETNSFAS